MVDYGFYRDTYLGSSIPQSRFPQLAARAAEELQRLKRICRVEGGEDAQAMAVCAMAEALNTPDPGVRSATIGGVSVSYGQRDLRRTLYEKAGVYLDIYRGCGG